jgi:hypothetical protein
LNPGKCSFAVSEVEYLGHVVTRDGVKPDSKKVQAIKISPYPQKVKDGILL